MALLLNIDTSTERAGVCLSQDEKVLALLETAEQKNHASFIQPAIRQLLADAGQSLQSLDAIAVSAGPGSYTGLRVGLATAKGLCFALNKSLIMLNTLEIMAAANIKHYGAVENETVLFCPMIDARRMEVFTAVYDSKLLEKMPPSAAILDTDSFSSLLQSHKMVFSGSGSPKAHIISHPNAIFTENIPLIGEMAVLSSKAYNAEKFADLAYSEPFYLKEFYKPLKKN